jgi:hypothetical protein
VSRGQVTIAESQLPIPGEPRWIARGRLHDPFGITAWRAGFGIPSSTGCGAVGLVLQHPSPVEHAPRPRLCRASRKNRATQSRAGPWLVASSCPQRARWSPPIPRSSLNPAHKASIYVSARCERRPPRSGSDRSDIEADPPRPRDVGVRFDHARAVEEVARRRALADDASRAVRVERAQNGISEGAGPGQAVVLVSRLLSLRRGTSSVGPGRAPRM